MSDNSKIEWTEATWNFLVGCLKKSAGCMNCYAILQAWRLMHNPNPKIAKKFAGTVARDSKGALNWTGRINFDEDTLTLPLRWKEPRRIFVNSLSDLFHPNVKDEWIAAAFGMMALCPHHTFQILTKHPERAVKFFEWLRTGDLTEHKELRCIALAIAKVLHENTPKGISDLVLGNVAWPLPNVWILTSIEDQQTADERIPQLLKIPAAIRGVSAEPLLGPINLEAVLTDPMPPAFRMLSKYYGPEGFDPAGSQREFTRKVNPKIDWVIGGYESNGRPGHPAWIRFLRDQCEAAGVAFFFKQWGDFSPDIQGCDDPCGRCVMALADGITVTGFDWAAGPAMRGAIQMHRVGKKAAGATLDGREHKEFPQTASVSTASGSDRIKEAVA